MSSKFDLFTQISFAKSSGRLIFSKRMSHRRLTNWSKIDFVSTRQWITMEQGNWQPRWSRGRGVIVCNAIEIADQLHRAASRIGKLESRRANPPRGDSENERDIRAGSMIENWRSHRCRKPETYARPRELLLIDEDLTTWGEKKISRRFDKKNFDKRKFFISNDICKKIKKLL